MIAYLDTSAVARLYLPESNRSLTLELMRRASALTTHVFTRVEMASALAKAYRQQRISADDLKRAQRQFGRDWVRFNRILPDEATVSEAASLIERFVLRAMDAIHVAAAEQVRRTIAPEALVFLSFDVQQVEAARALGMTIPDLAAG